MIEVFASGDASGATDRVNVQAALNRVDDFAVRLRGNPFYFNDWLQPLATLPRKILGDGVDVQALVWVGSAARRGFFCAMAEQQFAVDFSDFSAVTFGAGGVLFDVSHPLTSSHREPALRISRVQQQLGDPAVHWWDYLLRMNNTWRAEIFDIEGIGPDDVAAVKAGTKFKATVQALGRCVGGHVAWVNATNVRRHVEILGEACEGWILEHCNAPLCYDGYIVERNAVSPGLTIFNCHADAYHIPIALKGVAQFTLLSNVLYRRPDANERWDGIGVYGNSQDGSVLNNVSVNNGPTDQLAYGVAIYDAFGLAITGNRGGNVHDVVRLNPGAAYFTVTGNRRQGIITGETVRNLSGYSTPPAARIEGND